MDEPKRDREDGIEEALQIVSRAEEKKKIFSEPLSLAQWLIACGCVTRRHGFYVLLPKEHWKENPFDWTND